MLYTIGIVVYILIGIFLNPLFRKMIRQDSSSLKFKELEGSILYSCVWPIAIIVLAFTYALAVVMYVCFVVYNLGKKLFNGKDINEKI